MKTLILVLALAVSAVASADQLTVTSTAIVDKFGPACASKGNDTEVMIGQAQQRMPYLKGLLSQKSAVNDSPVFVPPTTYFDPCAYRRTICTSNPQPYPYPYPNPGYPNQVCRTVCEGGYITTGGYTQDHYHCDTTLILDNADYFLALHQANTGDVNAAVNAATAVGNVVYSEVDHSVARWVTVSHK